MVRIVHSQTKQSLYTLGSFDFGPSQTNITFLPRIRAATDLVSFQSIDQKLNFNTIDEQLIINSDNLAEVTSTPFKLYNAKIDDSVLFSVFQICYPKLDDLTLEYESIKKQWTLIFPKQLEKQQQLQKAIKLIESDILSNKYFEGNKKLQKTALNVLLTYSIYNNDGAFYYHNELEFLIPLLDAYVKQYGNDYDPSKCETELFNIYDSFYKFGKFDEYKNLKKQRFIKPMLVDLGSQLKNNFSEMVHFLQQRNIISLDFFISQIRNWFVEAFDLESIQRLWISIPHLENSFSQSSESSSPSLEKFFACFVTAILYLTEKEMIDIYPICENEFVEFFQNVLKKVDMNKLLCYAKRIYGFYFK
ncbi:TBC1 domain family member 17 [Histomonas meleagridis]|uniref:TBC1 domain family member 17 n=1 Tax=Histomonas meleagridis TaxID=135588 RepID=UPI003559837F|nr:TBC1 domain family member 17 [Histomonas meleagridis]KAH0801600.1 TBC1 domain family member 17 [Histomonas meleagridis]